jgi:hypothetical protein
MAIKVVKQEKREFTYIPVEERGSENPVKVIFKPLTKSERAALEDKLIRINPDQTMTVANATYILEVFKTAVVDIQGLIDENGNEVKPKKEHGVLAQEFIEMLPDDFIQEVGNVIIAVSKDPQNADVYLGNVEEESKE